MPFHCVQSKKYGLVYFIDDKYCLNPNKSELDYTWAFSKRFSNFPSIEYMKIFNGGKSLIDNNSDELKQEFENINKRLQIYLKAIKHSQTKFIQSNIFDLIPIEFWEKYFGIKNKMLTHLKQNIPKPINYSFFVNLLELLEDIEEKKLNIPTNFPNKIIYNAYGSLTGRLTTTKKSFPILCLPKSQRDIIHAENDFLIEFDFNAVEPRTYLALIGAAQPEVDIHNWHQELYQKSFNVYIERCDIKEKFFAWFYGYKNEPFGISEIDKIYNKELILKKFWNNGIAKTIFHKEFEVPKERAFNNIIQSTAAYLFLEQAILINKFLKEHKTKTFVKMLIHDSLVLDFSKEDKNLYKEIISIFKKTRFGSFLVNIKAGQNFKDMKEI